MSRKSNISLSNRALFYPSRKETWQLHEESQNSNVVQRDLSKQETANSSFQNLPERRSDWTRRGIRYPRARVRSHAFENGEQSNKSTITSITPPLLPELRSGWTRRGLKAKAPTTQAKSNQYNLSYLRRVSSRVSGATTLWALLAERRSYSALLSTGLGCLGRDVVPVLTGHSCSRTALFTNRSLARYAYKTSPTSSAYGASDFVRTAHWGVRRPPARFANNYGRFVQALFAKRTREHPVLSFAEQRLRSFAEQGFDRPNPLHRLDLRCSSLAPTGRAELLLSEAEHAGTTFRLVRQTDLFSPARLRPASGVNFRIAKASRPSVVRLAQRAPEQHFGCSAELSTDPKGGTEGSFHKPSEARFGAEGLEHFWLLRKPRDISVHWLERLGFTFSPFAFIFGTTFFFAALASTLQKQDGEQWLETLSHTKLPGLTQNKISQMSSWVFLESVLSQYINRDSSLLVSAASLSQEAPYSARLRKAMPRTSTLVHGKPAIGALQFGAQNNFHTSVERLRLEDDSIPSKKDSIYSKNKTHQDTLSVRVLNVVKKSFYDYGFSIPGSAQPPILVPSGRSELLLSEPEHGFAKQSSRSQEGLDKLVESKNENLSLVGKDSVNRQLLAPFLLSRRLLGLGEQARVQPAAVAASIEHVLLPERPTEALLLAEGQPGFKVAGQEAEQPAAGRFAPEPCSCSASLSKKLSSRLGCEATQRPGLTKQELSLSSASRPSGARFASQAEPSSCSAKLSTSELDSGWLESKRNRNQVPAFVRRLNKSELLGKPTQSSYQAKANLDGMFNVTDQPGALRETGNLSKAGRRGDRVSHSSENSYKQPKLSFTKPGGLALIFRNIAIPKKSFWESAHSISGYNFPELQDDEVADISWKVTGSNSTRNYVPDARPYGRASASAPRSALAGPVQTSPTASAYGAYGLFGPAIVANRNVVPACSASLRKRYARPAGQTDRPCSRSEHSARFRFVNGFGNSSKALGAPRRGATIRRRQLKASSEQAKLGLPEKFVDVGSTAKEGEVAKSDRRQEQPLADGFTKRYTPLQLEQENKLKKAFKELGRDYSDYLKHPKDSLPALLLSPSLEEDKQIEEEEVQRLAQEKAAAKAAAKRTPNEEEYSLSDFGANEEELNLLDLDPSGQTELRSAIEVALREGKNRASNLEEDPLNDEDIEDSRFERLRFTREIETKKEEEDCRGIALSLTCRDSNALVAGLAGARQPGLDKINDKLIVGSRSNDLVSKEPNKSPGPTGTLGCLRRTRAKLLEPPVGGQQWPKPFTNRPPASVRFANPRLRFVQAGLYRSVCTGRLTRLVSDRKHSFFGQRSFWPTRLFSQEERLLSAHIVNPYILYDQSNPWLLPEQGGKLPVKSQTKPAANCPTSGESLASTGPGTRLLSEAEHGGRLLALRSKVCKTDDLQNLKNLQTQARLGLIRFVYLPVVEAALVYSPATRAKLLEPPVGGQQLAPLRLLSEANSQGPAARAGGRLGWSDGGTELLFSEAEQAPRPRAPIVDLIAPGFAPQGLAASQLSQPGTDQAGNQNRIYKPDPRLRLTPLESSISADWRNDRKVEASAFRVTSKERPYIVLPQLSENEWQKSIEWQLRRHFLDEDTRLEPLVATEPYKTFKVKRIDRSLPWLTLAAEPPFKLFQWPYKPVGVLATECCQPSLLNPYVPVSAFSVGLGRAELLARPLQSRAEQGQQDIRSSCPISLGSSKATYSKDRSAPAFLLAEGQKRALGAVSIGSNPLFDVTKKLFSSQDNVNTELLFEPPSTSSWFLIYRLFLALILKEVFKYIYRISLKDFFIRIINSDFGRTITSPEFRQSVQFEPFPEFYKPKNRLKDLIGIKNAFLPLSEIIWFLRNNCRSRNGPHGVVLLGPEGVDTTAIAQAVAGEAKVPIIVQSLRALTLTHSHPQKRLEKILLLARAQAPCVLFLDELDVIGQAREGVIRNTSGDGNSLTSLDSSQLSDRQPQLQSPDDHATSQGRRVDLMLRLLTVMDGLHHLNGVVIITTSKNTATLDPALLRPGRFDRLIHLTLPNHEHRLELFKVRTSGLTLAKLESAELLLSKAEHGLDCSPFGANRPAAGAASVGPRRTRAERGAAALELPHGAPRLGHTDQIPLGERSSLLSVAELEYLSDQTANMGGADIVSAINYSTLRAIVNDTVHTVETLEYGLNCVKALKGKQGRLRRSLSSP